MVSYSVTKEGRNLVCFGLQHFVSTSDELFLFIFIHRILVAYEHANCNGGAENDGHENDGHKNDGPSKCPGMKLTDMKITDMKLTDMKMQDMFQVSE